MTVVGNAVVPVTPDMSQFQAQTAAGINQSSKGLSSTLKSVGAAIGITFGAAMAVSIGKKSLEAFDIFEKGEKRLEFGLQQLGANGARQLQPITDWAKGFSAQSGVLTQDIVDMASKLTTMGTAFFKAAGPDAAKAIEQLTGGLIDMAAATGKSSAMLMRSLGPAILNTPAKAIPLLQKYGVITADQAEKIKALTAEGKNYEATQAEINDLTLKYGGAARDTATAITKLKAVWNNLEISIGSFLSRGASVLLWLTRSSAAADILRKAIIALTVAWAAWKALAFVPVLLDAMSASMFKLAVVSGSNALLGGAVALEGLGAAAAAATLPITALAGAGFLLYKMFTAGNIQITTYNQALRVAGEQLGRGADAAKIAARAHEILNANVKQGADSQKQLSGAIAEGTAKTVQFAHMSGKALDDWRTKIQTDSASAITALDGVTLATHKTTRAFIHGQDVMKRAAEQAAAAIRALAKQDWVPEEYKKWLLEQGPAAVANFESANKKNQHEAVRDWRATQGAATSYQRAVERITGAIAETGRALENLTSRRWNISVHGLGLTKAQHGFHGMVTQPTVFLAGEAGSERVDVTPSGGISGGLHIHGERVAPTSEDLGRILRRARVLSGV